MGAAEILSEAKVLLAGGDARYRDTLLAVGRMLHEYLLAFMREGDGMCEQKRLDNGCTRAAAVKNIQSSLGESPKWISDTIATAMAADLLAAGNVGDLGFAAVRQFSRFVHRRSYTDNGRKVKTTTQRRASIMEEWEVKPEFQGKAQALFRRAVGQRWNQGKAAVECRDLLRDVTPEYRPTTKSVKPIRNTEMDRIKTASKRASPGDIAAMCMEFVLAAEDPYAVAQSLIGRLSSIKRPRQAFCG